MLSKLQIINAIQQINRSVSAEWLGAFDASALRQYLDHLQLTQEPRGRRSIWRRPGESAAVITRQPWT